METWDADEDGFAEVNGEAVDEDFPRLGMRGGISDRPAETEMEKFQVYMLQLWGDADDKLIEHKLHPGNKELHVRQLVASRKALFVYNWVQNMMKCRLTDEQKDWVLSKFRYHRYNVDSLLTDPEYLNVHDDVMIAIELGKHGTFDDDGKLVKFGKMEFKNPVPHAAPGSNARARLKAAKARLERKGKGGR